MKTPNGHAVNVLLVAISIGTIALAGLVTVASALVRVIAHGNYLEDEVRRNFISIGWGINMVAAALLGVCRPSTFHPLNVVRYQTWLKTTPWHSGKPLPLGPVHLLPVEWGLLAFWMAMITYISHQIPFHLPVVFLTAYLVPMIANLFKTDEEAIATTLLFGVGGIVRLWSHPIPCLILVLTLYTLAYLGLRRSLRRFPWPESETAAINNYGWPLQQLGPAQKDSGIPFTNAVVIALLVGWLGYVALYALTDMTIDSPNFGAMLTFSAVAALVGMLMGFIRMGAYSNGYAAPITLWGRIRTGRLIIPSHDNAKVAPVLLPVFGALAMTMCMRLDLSLLYSMPLVFSLLLLLAMLLPPGRQEWRLMGEHRLIPVNNRRRNTQS